MAKEVEAAESATAVPDSTSEPVDEVRFTCGGRLVAADPRYAQSDKRDAPIYAFDARCGEWIGSLGRATDETGVSRIESLTVRHESLSLEDMRRLVVPSSGRAKRITVDSGLVGFFDQYAVQNTSYGYPFEDVVCGQSVGNSENGIAAIANGDGVCCEPGTGFYEVSLFEDASTNQSLPLPLEKQDDKTVVVVAARMWFIAQPSSGNVPSSDLTDLQGTVMKGASVDTAELCSRFVTLACVLLNEKLPVWDMAPERGERALVALAERFEAKLKARGHTIVWYQGFAVW
jgi:hypothetical protein